MSAWSEVTQEIVVLLKKGNTRASARLQAFLPFVPDSVSVLQPSYLQEFKSLPTNIPFQSPQRRQAGKWNMGKMSVRFCYTP